MLVSSLTVDDSTARPAPATPRYTPAQIDYRRRQARSLDGREGHHVWLSRHGRYFMAVRDGHTEMAGTMAAMEELLDHLADPAGDVLGAFPDL